jgi:hypothetical protein
MKPLDTLKDKLKIKPIVEHKEGVKVVIGQKQTQIIIQDEDEGKRAQDILERMRKYQLTNVRAKFPEAEPKKTPEPTVKPTVKPKVKKAPVKLILEEELEKQDIDIDFGLPKGGPQLEEKEEPEEPEEIIFEELPKPKKRITKKLAKGVVEMAPHHTIQIGDTTIPQRLPKPPRYELKTSTYYMNNREIFINFINNLFEPYREDLLDETKGISCDTIGKETGEVSLLTHQKIVRDYINLHTPYRGLLLYHGLGSGKTCSSIAIAEGLKSSRKIIVMTPASLRRNYMEEIKKCGDLLYRKNQYWEWISSENNTATIVDTLSAVLSLPREYIRRKGGAWLVNVTKDNNYASLGTEEKKSLNDQLDEMIQNKYTFINYNGLRREKFKQLTNNFETNIFDNSVVIIDEAHNLISRIVNKINKTKKISEKKRGFETLLPGALALQIYEFLLRANNCRIVLLTGTPIINYPNEIAILFNILRGYIKTWNLPLSVETNKKVSKETLLEIFSREKVLDYVDYSPSSKTLTITRNPFGFENKITERSGYKGVTNDKQDRGLISDSDFLTRIVKLLKKNDIIVNERGTVINVNTALPDTLDEFINNFIDKDTGVVSNIEKFKRRIIGLTSYFRSAQEELLPRYDKIFNKRAVFIPMSNYQFQIYEEARQEERQSEKGTKGKKSQVVDKDGLFVEPSSTYRIFSRLFCNYVMPKPPGRPKPLSLREEKVEEAKAEEKKVESKAEAKMKAKEEKEQVKAEAKMKAKEEKERAKAEAKMKAKEEKERAKAQAKEEKEREKERKKAEKEAKKKQKGGDESDSDTDSDSESDSDTNTNIIYGGQTSPIEEFVENANPDEVINIPGYKDIDANLRDIDELEGDELLEVHGDESYKTNINNALKYLVRHKSEYLSLDGLQTYSPKYLAMIENIQDPEHQGLHLIYSQFRSMEGIGIFSLALEANGFARFKIKKTGLDSWQIEMDENDVGKPTYALYTGTEDAEEREIIRNIYNGSWDNIPNNIANQLRSLSTNNNLGEIIKVLMITSAGSEGINLRNTRYVHIMEPYWHPVRVEQVIGRARRICSHKDLPTELQTVDVFIYIMTFTEEQLRSDYAIELKLKDLSKQAPYVPQTSDETLFEISNIKENLSSQLLKAIKETSIDCVTHAKASSKEGLVCLTFGQPTVNEFSYNPNYAQDENDTVANINRVTVDWEAKPFKWPGISQKLALRVGTDLVYDYDSVIQAREIPGVRPLLIGKLEKRADGKLQLVKGIDL